MGCGNTFPQPALPMMFGREGRHPRLGVCQSRAGFTFVEVLAVMVVIATLAGALIPETLGAVRHARARAAARYVAGRVALARMQAVRRSAAVALRFERDDRGYVIASFVDGNRNGVRSQDIQRGLDRPIESPVRLVEQFPGVDFATGGDVTGDPIRLGGTLLTLTPLGTATAGTLYVRGSDGSQYAIRVTGATGRARLEQYDHERRTWAELR